MRKKLAKWIGSLILISMILTSVCPLSVLAADEPAPAETTVVMEAEMPQETQQEAPAAVSEAQVTEVPGTEDAAVNRSVTEEADQEKGTNMLLDASEEGLVAGGEKATNSNEKKEDPDSSSEDPNEKNEDISEEKMLDEIQAEEIESKEEMSETVKFEQVLGESNTDEKAEEEKKDNSEVAAPAISVTWPENLPDAGVKVLKTTDDTEFAMFKLTGTKMYSPDKEKLYVHVETANVSFDKIYFGPNTDGLKTGYILGTEISETGGWVFEFELPYSAAGNAQNVVLGKPDGTWYTKAQLKMDIPAYQEPEEPKEEAAPAISVTWPENLPDAGVKVLKTTDDTEFAMFKLTGTKMYSPDKAKLYVHVETANTSFDKIYFGPNTDGLKTGYIQGTEISETGGWVFEFELPYSAAGNAQNVVLGKSDGTWYTKAQLKMNIPAYQEPEEPEPEPETLEDGDYEVKATSDNDMFRIIDAKLKVENGTMMADITLSGTGYDLMFAGTKEEAEAAGQSQHIKYAVNDDGKYVFTIPVSSLDEALSFAAHTVKSNRWVDRKITFDSSTLKKIEEEPEKIEDGDYEVKATSDNDMFRIIDAKLKVKNGEMTADITLSGTGYDLMFTGTKEEADTADPSQHIKYTVNDDGKYVFTIPVSSLDEALSFAAHTVKSNKWVDRKITFDSSTLKKIEEGQDPEPEPEPEPEKPVTPQEESQHETDLSGATAAVDNSTTLPDGVYTPDSFSFSGGSGRVTITCSQITVTNGQAFATIAFSSSNYSYVKASGNTYFPTLVNGASTFTIPIALNQNNKIIGMTTAMSQAHEVDYTIFVYIAAAAGQEAGGNTIGEDNKLDEKAPVIAGIGEGEEIKLEKAELLKMFRYSNGCVLVEIDRTRGTVLDPEKLAKEAEENKDAAEQTEASDEEMPVIMEEEGSQSNVKTEADYAMELYQADVVKYLIVPEGVEIPAGMEKQVLVIHLPKESVYVSSEAEAEVMESLGLLEIIKAAGVKEENCKIEALKKLLQDKKVVSSGSVDDLKYTELVKAEADLAIAAGGEILPKEAEKDKTAKDYQDQYTKISERMALLDIPMLIDRSADEKDPKGALEWLKLYGVLFGKENEADALITKGN